MTRDEQVRLLDEALRRIGEIAVEPGTDPMAALIEAQTIAEEARRKASTLTVLPLARLSDL